MTKYTFTPKELSEEEEKSLTAGYNGPVAVFEVSPQLPQPLMPKIKKMSVSEVRTEPPGAEVVSVSPREIVILDWCPNCTWELIQKISKFLERKSLAKQR